MKKTKTKKAVMANIKPLCRDPITEMGVQDT